MRPRVLIYDYGCGNHGSLVNWLELAGFAPEVSTCLEQYKAFKIVLLPGVGDINTAMSSITKRGHLDLIKEVFSDPKILLIGICLGFQILSKFSDESLSELTLPLSLLPLTTCSIYPYVGWRQLAPYQRHINPLITHSSILSGLSSAEVFFNHSYAIYHSAKDSSAELRQSIIYGSPLPSPAPNPFDKPVNYYETPSVIGMQFHPERSQLAGLHLARHIHGKIS